MESVAIAGQTDFSRGAIFNKDVKITVTYHTFPEKEKTSAATTPAETTAVAVPPATTAPTKTVPVETILAENFPVEYAMRAAVVAFTNYYADDVFNSDGNSYNVSKFHSYADVSGSLMIVTSEGKWSAKNENTWHVEHLKLKVNIYNTTVDASLDVSYDGENYVISNLKGKAPSYNDISVFEEERDFSLFFVVPPKLVKDDRAAAKELKEYDAWSIFEEYGKTLYPYGFKCSWYIGMKVHEQSYDGSWYLRVSVTITDKYGATRNATAEAFINSTTKSVENFKVY